MRIYEFKCYDCGKKFGIAEENDKVKRCPLCGGGDIDLEESYPVEYNGD